MATVGIVIRAGVPAAVEKANDIISWLKENKHQVLLDTDSAKVLSGHDSVAPDILVASADPIVTLGGDGTLIRTARLAQEHDPLMIGVNFGRLGFLTEIAPDELLEVLQAHFEGGSRIGERSMLQAQVVRSGKAIHTTQAVNDCVIQKQVTDPLLELDLKIEDDQVLRLRADGLIVSTPTGSTAYSLAAGGSIVHPTLRATLVTPICPHSLTIRPLIVPEQRVLTVNVPEYRGGVVLTVDGQESMPLRVGDAVRISKSQHTVRFVRSPSHSYFDILRNKLNWGLPSVS